MKFAFPQWKGFELAPEGQLLDQIVDLSGPMGMAYERSAGFAKAFHTHDRPMIVLPRGSCRVRVRTGRPRAAYQVDHASLLIVPRGVEHDDEALTAIFDTVALYPSAALLEQVINDEGFPAARVRALFGRCQKLARSRWLGQLLQEYIFARVVSRRESVQTVAFLERQILVELIASALGRRRSAEAGSSATAADDKVVGRALRHIEANLFARLTIAAIAREAFASPSTLLRQFRREMGHTPLRYITRRRLEEARRLLEADNHTVGEVAALVGYENFGAFSTPSGNTSAGRPRPSSAARAGGSPGERGMAHVISIHEYDLRPGSDPARFEQALHDAEARGLLKLPGLTAHYFVKGMKGARTGAYAAVWIYQSREAWERIWGRPERPKPPDEYPESWKVWEEAVLAPFLRQQPDQIRFTTYEVLDRIPDSP